MTDPNQNPNQNPLEPTELPGSTLANEPTQIPVSEIPSEVKSIEELSGVKESANEILQETSSLPPEMQPTSAPAEIHTTGDSRAKIVKIVVPIVVAIALGLGGFLVYSFFIKGDAEEAAPTEGSVTEESVVEEETTPPATEEPVITEEELEQILNEGIEIQENTPEEASAEETSPDETTPPAEETPPETPKVKVPRS